jgi:hypothetical protein
MSDAITARLQAQRAMTPKPGEGYNVVGVDTFEDPGDELYLIGNYSTRAEAEKKAESYRKAHPDEERIYIYGEPGLKKSGAGPFVGPKAELKKARKARGGAYKMRVVLPNGKLKFFYDHAAYDRWCDRNDVEPHVSGERKAVDAAARRGHALVSNGPAQASTYDYDKLEEDVPGPRPGAERMDRLQAKMKEQRAGHSRSARHGDGGGDVQPIRQTGQSRSRGFTPRGVRATRQTGQARVGPRDYSHASRERSQPKRSSTTSTNAGRELSAPMELQTAFPIPARKRRGTKKLAVGKMHGKQVHYSGTRNPIAGVHEHSQAERRRALPKAGHAKMVDTDYAELGAAFMSAKAGVFPPRMGSLPQRLRERRAARAEARRNLPKTGHAKMTDADYAELGAAFMSAKQTRDGGSTDSRLRITHRQRAKTADRMKKQPMSGKLKPTATRPAHASVTRDRASGQTTIKDHRSGRSQSVRTSAREHRGLVSGSSLGRRTGARSPTRIAPDRRHDDSATRPPRRRSQAVAQQGIRRSDLVRPDLKKHTGSKLVYRAPQSRKISLEW